MPPIVSTDVPGLRNGASPLRPRLAPTIFARRVSGIYARLRRHQHPHRPGRDKHPTHLRKSALKTVSRMRASVPDGTRTTTEPMTTSTGVPAAAADAAGTNGPKGPQFLLPGICLPTFGPFAGRRLRLLRWYSASARRALAEQSVLDHAM